MKAFARSSFSLLLLFSMVVWLGGCSGGGDDNNAAVQAAPAENSEPETYANVQGNWTLTIDNVLPVGMSLNQTGNQVSGTYTLLINTYPCSGEVVGDNFVIVVEISNPGDITLTGTVNGNTMGGTWTQDNSGNGTFTGTR